MKKIIEKIGMDKIVHFAFGGLVTALITLVALIQDFDILTVHPWKTIFYPIIGVVVTGFLSWVKEMFADEQRDWWDVYSALIGSGLVFICVFIGVIFYVAG